MNIEQRILSLNDAYHSYNYCINNKEIANIKAHEQIIINSNNLKFCYLFAKDIPEANINALEQVIINSKNLRFCFWFARDISGSNKQLLFEAVLASGNLHYIMRFYNEIDFDKYKYESLMLFI
jgi:hypothetical protein